MRRTDREVTVLHEIEDIISRCQVCHLGLSGGSNEPYVVPLNFGYAPGNPACLFFHCATDGRKLAIIRQNPRAAFTLDRLVEIVTAPNACDWGARYESVMGTGTIEIVSDPAQRIFGLDRIMAQYGSSGPTYYSEALRKTVVLKLSIEQVTAKRRT